MEILKGKYELNINWKIFNYSLIFATLILSLFNNLFLVLFLVLSLIHMLISSGNEIIELLFFLLPFDSIILFNLNQLSMFALLTLIAVLLIAFKRLVTKSGLDVKKLIWFLILVIFISIFGFHSSKVKNLTMGFALLFLFFNSFDNKLLRNIVLLYSISLILASIVALLSDKLPRITILTRTDVPFWIGMETVNRFSGLSGDPNYYALDLFLALTGLWQLYHRKQINTFLFLPIFCILSAFGFLTLSKSFILVYIVFLIIVYIFALKTNVKTGLILGVIILICVILGYIFFSKYINIYVSRFFNSFDGGLNLDKLLTGRWTIWKNYWNAITDNTRTLLVGYGASAGYVNKISQHNAYIEALYHLGFLGTSIYLLTILRFTRAGKKTYVKGLDNKIPLFIFAMLIFALSFIFNNAIYFFLCILLGCMFKKEAPKLEKLKFSNIRKLMKKNGGTKNEQNLSRKKA